MDRKRSHFVPTPQPSPIEPAADLATVVRRLEQLTATPRRPSDFIEQKQAIIRDLRRLAAVQRYGGSRR
jgi:hypothetical protein